MSTEKAANALPLWTIPGMKPLHRFRSRVLGLTEFDGRLIAATERGVYVMDKNGKRWRKIALQGKSRF